MSGSLLRLSLRPQGWRGAYSFTTVEGLQPRGQEREEEWKELDYILLTRRLALCKLQFKLDQSSRAELRLVGSERERFSQINRSPGESSPVSMCCFWMA